jgi:hypothetical protein
VTATRASYRCLDYAFVVECAEPALRARLGRLLAPWAVDTAADAPVYALVATDTSAGPWYHLGRGGDELAVGPDAGDVVDQLLFAVSAAAFASTCDQLLVHAGAVVAPDGTAVLLPGPSGAGKTTLVAGLVRAGFGYLSDEAGAIDPVTLRVHAFARPLGLKGEARSAFGVAAGPGADDAAQDGVRYLAPDDLRPGATSGPVPVGHVVAPCYERDVPTTVTRMTPAETVLELGAAAMNLLDLDDGLAVLAAVARRAPGARLVSGDLDAAVAAVRELTGA